MDSSAIQRYDGSLMWEHYKKTLIPMQILIVAVTVTVYFILRRQWLVALVVFVVMQLGSLAGAAWGARLSRRIKQRSEELPLKRN